MNRKVILWFRQDLRIHDNEALGDAIIAGDEILPVYIFDERVLLGKTKYGFRKTHKFRTKFIIESVANLRKNLQRIGLDLLICIGKPEEVFYNLAKKYKTSWIFCNRERTEEEKQVQDNLEKNLWSIGQEIWYSMGKMLFYTADLPFPVTHSPDNFGSFRKEVEKIVDVRKPLKIPRKKIAMIQEVEDFGAIPQMVDFEFDEDEIREADRPEFIGGEDKALERLNYCFWQSDLLSNFKNSRKCMMGMDNSTKYCRCGK